MAAMLEVKDIHCGYDGAPVIRGLSLEVCEGEIVAILGANGAGKSTTMRTICGLMHPEKGQILFSGVRILPYRRRRTSGKVFHIFKGGDCSPSYR